VIPFSTNDRVTGVVPALTDELRTGTVVLATDDVFVVKWDDGPEVIYAEDDINHFQIRRMEPQ
jgi:hypothetical protein